jgi:hypothetical protein
MIDDETLGLIAALDHGDRPLIVCDVDEVILHFVTPFMAYLRARGHVFHARSYRLTGNILHEASGRAATQEEVWSMLGGFFDEQHEWQHPVEGAREHLHGLADTFDVVLLTAMPHAHRSRRVSFLKTLGFEQPVLTVESDKGPAVARLAHGRPHVAFIDDLAHNHLSVAEHHPQAHLHQIMAFRDYEGGVPAVPEGVSVHTDWDGLSAALRLGHA